MRSYMLLVTLFICALTDIVTFRIRNVVLLISATGLLFFDIFIFPEGDPASDLKAGIIVFIILIPFYIAGILSAGDIKLLMLTAMYTGLSSLCHIAAASIIASLLIVISIGCFRHEPFIKIKFPFAFALFLGAFPFWSDYFQEVI